MGKLLTPEAISFSLDSEKKIITIEFTGKKDDKNIYPDNLQCDVRIVKRNAPKSIIKSYVKQTASLNEKKLKITVTVPEGFVEKEQTVQVMALAENDEESNSDWGTAAFWVVSPSLTLLIGTYEVILSQDTLKSSRRFKLPAPVDITYDDIAAFAKKLGLTLPETFPDGSKISDLMSLHIQNIFIDLDGRLFDLDFSIIIPDDSKINIIPNIKIKRVGVAVKHTDGSF